MAVTGRVTPGAAGEEGPRAGRPPRSPSRSTLLGAAALVLLLVALRLPTLFEPAWSFDEGAYANIGRALDHGAPLYDGIWDNKPPGMYWLSALATAGGASALRMQVLLTVIVALSTLCVVLLGRRLSGSARVGLVAGALFAVVASVPNFTGDQLNAEIVGALPVLAAMLVLLRRSPIGRTRALGAGLLLGAALLFKATFAADVLAGLAVPLLAALAERRRPGRAELEPTLLVLAGVLLLCGAAAGAVALRGSLPALVDVLVDQGPRYAAWGQTAGPAGTPPADYTATPSGLLRALAYSRLLVVLLVGAGAALLLARRGRRAESVVAFWLACDLAATMVDNRALTHYVQQLAGALALAAALLAAWLWAQRPPAARLLAVAVLPAMWAVMLGALYLPRAEAAVATGHPAPQLSLENSSGRELPGYYRRALGLATGRLSLDAYHQAFAGAAWPAGDSIAALLIAHSRPGQRVFIWGELSAWAYAAADRVPASRFIWMDSAYHLYPGGEAVLVGDLERTPPAVLLAEQPPSPRLLAFLQGHGYTVAEHTPYGDCWVATGAG